MFSGCFQDIAMMSDPTLFSKGNIVFDDPKEFDDPKSLMV